jgi:hypothetical protein
MDERMNKGIDGTFGLEKEVACHNCCKFAVALYPDFYSLL